MIREPGDNQDRTPLMVSVKPALDLAAVRCWGAVPVMPSSVVSPMRCLKEVASAMAFIEPRRPACPRIEMPGSGRESDSGSARECGRCGGRRWRGILHVQRDHSCGSVVAQNAHKRGCAQCAHPGLRIRVYRHRTRPDCGGFRGSGGFSTVGARFESHPGHVFPLFRAFKPLSVHKLCCEGPLRGPFLLVALAVSGGLLAFLDGRAFVR